MSITREDFFRKIIFRKILKIKYLVNKGTGLGGGGGCGEERILGRGNNIGEVFVIRKKLVWTLF